MTVFTALSESDTSELLVALAPFLQQLLVYHTLSTRRPERVLPAGLTLSVYANSLRRTQRALESVSLPVKIKGQLRMSLKMDEAGLPRTVRELAMED
jgi:hypothetical protein